MKLCRWCGNSIPDAATECPWCGERQASSRARQNGFSWWAYLSLALGLVCVWFLLGYDLSVSEPHPWLVLSGFLGFVAGCVSLFLHESAMESACTGLALSVLNVLGGIGLFW